MTEVEAIIRKHFAEDYWSNIRDENTRLRDEVARTRPVVEAARKYVENPLDRPAHMRDLFNAVKALPEREGGE